MILKLLPFILPFVLCSLDVKFEGLRILKVAHQSLGIIAQVCKMIMVSVCSQFLFSGRHTALLQRCLLPENESQSWRCADLYK